MQHNDDSFWCWPEKDKREASSYYGCNPAKGWLPLVTKGKACLIHRCSLITAVLCCKPRGLLAFLISGALPVAHTFRFWPIKQKLSAAHHSQCCHSMTPLFFVELRLAITTFLSPDISCCLRLILVAYKLKLWREFAFQSTASTIPHICTYLWDAKCAKNKKTRPALHFVLRC